MGNWIAAHTQNWPIFVAATTLLGVVAARLWANGLTRRIPALFLGVWISAALALYVDWGVHRFIRYARHLWSAELATLAVIAAVPLLLVLLTLWLWMRRKATRQAWRSGAAVAACVGAMAMTLAPTLSGWLFRLLHSWVAMDRPGR